MAVILIVEDDELVLELVDLTVQDFGHETLLARDVEEACLVLRASPQIDLLITDIRLKAAANGGFELAQIALEFWPELRVLYTTGSALSSLDQTRLVAGGQWLFKPYSPVKLQASIQEILSATQ